MAFQSRFTGKNIVSIIFNKFSREPAHKSPTGVNTLYRKTFKSYPSTSGFLTGSGPLSGAMVKLPSSGLASSLYLWVIFQSTLSSTYLFVFLFHFNGSPLIDDCWFPNAPMPRNCWFSTWARRCSSQRGSRNRQ